MIDFPPSTSPWRRLAGIWCHFFGHDGKDGPRWVQAVWEAPDGKALRFVKQARTCLRCHLQRERVYVEEVGEFEGLERSIRTGYSYLKDVPSEDYYNWASPDD